MIGTTALARRIEAAEVRLGLAVVDGARERGDTVVFAERVGSGVAVYCGPGAPMTKVIGAGVAEPVTDEDIDCVEGAFAPVGERPVWEVSSLGDLASVRRLEGRGYRLQRVELVLGRDLARPTLIDPPPRGIVVTRGRDEDWARVAVAGFSVPDVVDGRDGPAEQFDLDALEGVMRQFAGAPDIRRYVALLDGEPAGAASGRVDAGLFQLFGAATLPQFRRRGVQGALLGARLAEARQAQCDLAVVTVEPGSLSQSNVDRRLFTPLYSRLVLAHS